MLKGWGQCKGVEMVREQEGPEGGCNDSVILHLILWGPLGQRGGGIYLKAKLQEELQLQAKNLDWSLT